MIFCYWLLFSFCEELFSLSLGTISELLFFSFKKEFEKLGARLSVFPFSLISFTLVSFTLLCGLSLAIISFVGVIVSDNLSVSRFRLRKSPSKRVIMV